MKPSEQRLSETRRQHTEAIVERHLSELFQRLPMLAGFWLQPDLELEELRSSSTVTSGSSPSARHARSPTSAHRRTST